MRTLGFKKGIRTIGSVLLLAASCGAVCAQSVPIHRYDFEGGALNDSGSVGGLDVTVVVAGNGATTPAPRISVTDGLGVKRRDLIRMAGGATDYMYLKHDPQEFALSSFTVMLWARTDTTNQGNYKGLFSSSEAVSTGFQIDSHQGVYRILGIDNGIDLPLGSVDVDRWQHLAMTYDDATVRAYLDGVETGSAAGSPGTTFRVVAIGSNRSVNHGFGGDIDDVRVYDRALDAQEIAEFMKQAVPRPTSGTVTEPFVIKVGSPETGATEETPRRMTPEPEGSGFTWGGYNQATATTAGVVAVVAHESRLVFEGSKADDAAASANSRGSYAYTIFDHRGGTTATRVVQSARILLEVGDAAPGQQVRWLIRDNGARWFLSQAPTTVSADTVTTVDVSALVWLRVNNAAETEMNQLDTDAQTPIDDPASLSPGAPDLTFLTGGGVYIESGDVSSGVRQNLAIDQIAWIQNVDSVRSSTVANWEQY